MGGGDGVKYRGCEVGEEEYSEVGDGDFDWGGGRG